MLDKLDLVLIMSVDQGLTGSVDQGRVAERLPAVRQRVEDSGRSIRLEVDSDIEVDDIAELARAGADPRRRLGCLWCTDYHAVVQAMPPATRPRPRLGEWRCGRAVLFDLDGTLVDSVPDLAVIESGLGRVGACPAE